MAKDGSSVFLSFARDELPFVRAVADEMRVQGVDATFDQLEVSAEDPIEARLSRALASSEVFVIFIGQAPESPWTNFEIGAAVGGKKQVVPVFLTEGARRRAPSVLSSFAGIDAYNLKPEEVAGQIARAVKTAA